MKQIELDRGQLDRLSVLSNDSRGRIKLNIPDPHHVGNLIVKSFSALFSHLSATQYCADSGDQFAGIKRLGKIIVGADFEAYNSVHIFTARREQQDGNPRRVSYSPQYVEAVHAGQHYVQHDQQVISVEGAIEAAGAVMNRFYLKALGLKILTYQAAQFHIVVDDQNAIHFNHFSK